MSDASFVTGLTRCSKCSAALVVGFTNVVAARKVQAVATPVWYDPKGAPCCIVAGRIGDDSAPDLVLMEALRKIAHEGGVCPGHRVSAVCLLQDDHDRAVRFCFEGPDPADPPGDGWPWQEEGFGGGE